MLRKLDKIRFRGHKRDDFLDLAESPNASDTECGDEAPLKVPRTSARDSEELRDPVSTPRRLPGARGVPPLGLRPWALGVGPPSSGVHAECGLGQSVSCPLVRDKRALLSLPPALPLVSGGARPQIQDATAFFFFTESLSST